ncbi:MAG: triosephosphate isomerase [Candidatus Pacebacteria bacterium]|nr:triosephosphate isomerase [Candidatus Paceibacterota bacterium]
MLIISNWKAYVESKEKAKTLFLTAQKLAKGSIHDLVLTVPAPYIGMLANGKSLVALGAQDISGTLGGATTGEVTAGVLSDLGATYVLIGHSERRAMGETDALLLEKTQHALAHGLTPVLCVGERERDEDAKYLKIIRAEIADIFGPLTQKERMEMVIAYEPIWAIGKTAAEAITKDDLREMIAYIRKVLGDYLPGKAASRTKILYGGSAEAANAPILADDTGIDGFLVGHASADVANYTALIKALS